MLVVTFMWRHKFARGRSGESRRGAGSALVGGKKFCVSFFFFLPQRGCECKKIESDAGPWSVSVQRRMSDRFEVGFTEWLRVACCWKEVRVTDAFKCRQSEKANTASTSTSVVYILT